MQEALEDAAARLEGAPIRVHGAGRTDTGVHATGQVAHIDFTKDCPADTVRDAINAHLRPEPVAILSAERVTEAFDARHSARARHYLYRIVNRRPPLALDRTAWHVAAAARRGGDARRGAASPRPARLHHVPRRAVPGEEPACARSTGST